MEKHKIERGSVQETLLIPLYGKKMAVEMFPDLFDDRAAVELWSKIEYDMPKQSKLKLKMGAIMAGTRQYDLAAVCRDYLLKKPAAAVVNMGCGLDTTFYSVANGRAQGYNIDLPDVIDVRNQLLPARSGEKNIAVDLTDYSWFDQIDFDLARGAVFFAAGVFYYFKRAAVRDLFINMAAAFPGAKLVFDATNARGLKKMLKTWLGPANMKNVGVYFSIEDAAELKAWSGRIEDVVRKGYMTGYRPLDSRYGLLMNAIFNHVDKAHLGSIVEITFKEL